LAKVKIKTPLILFKIKIVMIKKLDKNIMAAISGGRSSVKMAWHLENDEKYKDYNITYVFCNTGQERKETINFLKNMVKYWGINLIVIEGVYSLEMGIGVTYKITDLENLNMTSMPFEEMIEHKNKGVFSGLPSKDAPYCSENLKTLPAKKLCDDIYGVNNYYKAIGFRKEDMPKRISFAEIKEDKQRIFPLITDFKKPISQLDLTYWWRKQPFKLEIHGKFGNCELCWKKSQKNLIENIRFGTRSIEWTKKMENKYNSLMFRGNKSISELVEIASKPYTLEMQLVTEDDTGCVCSF
jgi:3'-phosphoadenosine 5'-phosphosulfate sulfotransferase (PAPS reductase)/FAD synthetase